MLSAALSQAWPPFVLVAGLLGIGAVAHEDGTFDRVGAWLEQAPGPPAVLFALSCALLAVVTAVLNLDTAVVFVTPVVVLAARRRGLDPTPFLYAALLMANASSLYLPGSNLTNLLVLRGSHGGSFVAQMWKPALAATLITAAGLGVAFGSRLRPSAAGARPADTDTTDTDTETQTETQTETASGVTGIVAALAAAVAVVLFTNPALPVLGVAILAVLARRPHGLIRTVSPHVLAAIFALATALGILARAWHGPAHLLAHATSLETTGIAAGTSVLINNLPAAVLLSARPPAHPDALLLGLDLGPNLVVTGSLAAYLWFAAARQLDLRPSAWTVTRLGIVLAPLSMLAGLALLGS